ncbi:conserved hypothetical protein [Aliarcobacter butzleri JV22]|uniref:HD domain-containing protein n=1 Tax=Aliarcobacter butzleri TaxID=28197 RepID=UPI0001F162CC|nr:HD domain-containing protein [Aliarcobacter butzleri]EFU70295.1 conserved hypothetical protein [Aliarcobacter butzleri JV22]
MAILDFEDYAYQTFDVFIDKQLLGILKSEDTYKKIINSKTFKRLSNIRFLGAIDYISTNKRRYDRYYHSISVATLGLYYSKLKYLNEYETKHLAVASLLHDIGHGPLSHSMEPAFQDRFGISHHTNSNDIIKGNKTLFKDEINSILRDENINIEYVLALLNNEVSNDTSFALTNPINIDTIDGIYRTYSQSLPTKTHKLHLALLPKQKEIVEALVNKDKNKLDDFWKLKDRVYKTIIHKEANLKADNIAIEFVKYEKNIDKESFFFSDKEFKKKYSKLFEKLAKNEIKEKELVYKKRNYYIDEDENASHFISRYKLEKQIEKKVICKSLKIYEMQKRIYFNN